jgi:hypothetical protein
MKNLSAAQLKLDLPTDTTTPRTRDSAEQTEVVGDTDTASSADAPADAGSATASLKNPNFGDLASIYAITSRRAGRLNATKITAEEHESLLRERQSLLDKKFAEQITKREANRLEYVRWSLDRIEDAKHGDALDELEAAVVRYEQLEGELMSLGLQLSQALDYERSRQQRSGRRR